jgi:CCDC81-like prokaryotic HU domain 2/CCDC81-like prokaryotic HU domain 1
MKIEHHISQLLYRYQCVTVPGFGAFLTETQSAQLHEGTHTFSPPKKVVSFNSHIKNNDGLLANHIAQVEKISFEVAVSNIMNEVAAWKNNLQIYGGISLHNIGELFFNSEHNLVFTPTNQINYLTDSFGLSSYVSPAVKREVYKQEVEELEEKAPIALTPERRNGSGVLKYAAMFVLGAGLLTTGGFLGNNYYQSQIKEQTLLVETKVQQQVNQKIQEATFFIENPIPNVTLSVDGSENSTTTKAYHLVAGVYQKEFYANKLFAELQQLGYKPTRLAPNKFGAFPVIYGSYTSYIEAQNALTKIQSEHNPEAWIMIKELK